VDPEKKAGKPHHSKTPFIEEYFLLLQKFADIKQKTSLN